MLISNKQILNSIDSALQTAIAEKSQRGWIEFIAFLHAIWSLLLWSDCLTKKWEYHLARLTSDAITLRKKYI